jgi:ketosteroid isomerase-like protein
MAERNQDRERAGRSELAKESDQMAERIPGVMAETVVRLFARGEAFDSDGFAGFFIEQPVYQFGNATPCLDRPAIRASVSQFFGGLDALYHDIKTLWEVGDTVFVEMDVTYWRKAGSSITLPCADIVRFEGDKVQELRIFMDANPVVDPSATVPASASVMLTAGGGRITPPGFIKKFFAENPEGKARIAQGLGPKWAVAGPKWNI